MDGGPNKQLARSLAGGGIGGLAAALALVRRGFALKVRQQAPHIGEIGAGSNSAQTHLPLSMPWA